MLDALNGEEQLDEATLTAILWALHPIEDYGIYEAAYSVLSQVDGVALGTTAARVLPAWLRARGEHTSIQSAVGLITVDDEASAAFLATAREWTAADLDLVRAAVREWVLDDEDWEPIAAGLGVAVLQPGQSPIPSEWPDEWRSAAQAFRSGEGVNPAWSDEAHFENNFDRVFAIMELEHGPLWRDVADFLNPVFRRRHDMIPAFVAALRELPADRRKRILKAVKQADPGARKMLRKAGV
jgi:hypothetical protein